MSREFVMEVIDEIEAKNAIDATFTPQYFTELNLCLEYSKDLLKAVEECEPRGQAAS